MLKWGIIGTGRIARRFMEGLSYSEKGEIYALASLTNADKLQAEFPNLMVYDDYFKLLDDPKVDIVYISTRHKDHYRWSIEALKRKKAVLCEKPATLTFEENVEITKVARENNTFFMEAMKTRFIPLISDIKNSIKEGMIGNITRVETCFSNYIPKQYIEFFKSTNHYLFDKEQGGVLNDTGSYCIASILDYIRSPIKTISGKVQFDLGVDVNDFIELTFESGQTACIDISLNEDKPKIGTIYGTKGRIIIEPFYRPTKAKILLDDGTRMKISKDYIHDDFFTEIEEVHDCVLADKIESQHMSLEDSLKVREFTDQIRNKMIKDKNNYEK